MPQSGDSLRWFAAQIVVAHISHNETSTRALPELIRSVYQALANVAVNDATPPAQSWQGYFGTASPVENARGLGLPPPALRA